MYSKAWRRQPDSTTPTRRSAIPVGCGVVGDLVDDQSLAGSWLRCFRRHSLKDAVHPASKQPGSLHHRWPKQCGPDTGRPIDATAIDSRTPGNCGRRCRRPAWPSAVLRFLRCNSELDSSHWPYKAFRSCARCREHLPLTVSVPPSASPTFRSLFIQGGFSSTNLPGHSSARLDDVLSAHFSPGIPRQLFHFRLRRRLRERSRQRSSQRLREQTLSASSWHC
jgi:hypothetical protein